MVDLRRELETPSDEGGGFASALRCDLELAWDGVQFGDVPVRGAWVARAVSELHVAHGVSNVCPVASDADQTEQSRAVDRMSAGAGAQLRKQVLEVPFHGLFADVQGLGDQLVGQSGVEQS